MDFERWECSLLVVGFRPLLEGFHPPNGTGQHESWVNIRLVRGGWVLGSTHRLSVDPFDPGLRDVGQRGGLADDEPQLQPDAALLLISVLGCPKVKLKQPQHSFSHVFVWKGLPFKKK